jgi:hypothetical protein
MPNRTRSCFLHVPKSGGSSVISTLRATLGATALFHANESRYQYGPLNPLLTRFPVVAGHFSFAQISDVLLSNTFFFTFLRDPVDRVLSHYYYYRGLDKTAGYGAHITAAQEQDLEEFVTHVTERPSPWSNWQTFVFSGATDGEQRAEELLPAALRNLERIHFVGVHHELEEGFRRLCQARRWPMPADLPHVNVTKQRLTRDAISPQLRERLRQLNACDATLFEHAQRLWNDRKTRGPVSMPMKLYSPAVTASPNERVEHGTREIVFAEISVRTNPARPDGIVYENDHVTVQLRSHSTVDVDDLTVGIRLSDDLGFEVYGVNTRQLGTPIAARAGEDFVVRFDFDMTLAPGVYYLTTAIHAADDHLHKCYHWIDNAVPIECRRIEAPQFSGLVNLQAKTSVHTGSEPHGAASGI